MGNYGWGGSRGWEPDLLTPQEMEEDPMNNDLKDYPELKLHAESLGGPTFDAAARQEAPVENESALIVDLVREDLRTRARTGRAKYGTYLQAGNGRDALLDAYQEAIDLVMYLRQMIEERSYPTQEREGG